MPPIPRWAVAVGMFLLAASCVSACPFCESEIGEQVKAGIFNEDFGYNAFLTLLPFPILLAIVALIHFGPPWRPVSPQETAGPETPPVRTTPPDTECQP